MKIKYRIIKRHHDYIVQRKFLFFFWVNEWAYLTEDQCHRFIEREKAMKKVAVVWEDK